MQLAANRPIDPQTHRFHYNGDAFSDLFNGEFRLRGRVSPNAIVGSFRDRYTVSVRPGERTCWSGKSYRDPTVHFRARRLRG